MPGHSNEEAAVVPVVCGPPILAVRHQSVEVLLEGGIIHGIEGFFVTEIGVHGVGFSSVLVKNAEVELVWPPIGVGGAAAWCGGSAVHDGALCIVVS